MTDYKALLACYGGGHAQIVGSLYRAMQKRRTEPEVIGFTTAYRALVRAGVPARSVEALVDAKEDAEYLEAVTPFVKEEIHPDITPSETRSYYALGLRDLVERFGWSAAVEALRREGRKAFEPVSVMARYLQRTRPDIVVTTTSPRFELALLKAARGLGIPTLAIGDLFLIKERSWILETDYSKYLAVFSKSVADALVVDGFPSERIRATGNPAFDNLAPTTDDAERRKFLRRELGLDEKTVVLWPAAGSKISMAGQSFLESNAVIDAFEKFCQASPGVSYVFRSHPNHPFSPSIPMQFGLVDDGTLTPEEALLISDVVCVEASTMGLQAALLGKPVICVGFADYVIYPKYGLASAVDTLDEAFELIRKRGFALPPAFAVPPLGTASANVLAFIDDILASEARGLST